MNEYLNPWIHFRRNRNRKTHYYDALWEWW